MESAHEKMLDFKIGTRTQCVLVPEQNLLGILEPNQVPVTLS